MTTTSTTTQGLGKNVNNLTGSLVNKLGNWMDNGKGYNPYPGQPYTDLSQQTRSSLQQMEQLAGQGNPFYPGAQTFTNDLITGHYSPDAVGQYGTGIASGAQGITAGNQLQQLLGQGMPNAAQQYAGGIASGQNTANALGQYATGIASGAQKANAVDQYGKAIASGQNGIGTEADYRSLMSAVDPAFESMLNNTLNDVGDQLQRQWGGASYGSAGNADYVTKGIGQLSDQLRSQHFYDNLSMQRGLLNDITGVQGQNIANQLSATGMLSGEQLANLQNQLSASGMLSNEQAGNLGRQLQAAGLISGEQLAGINTQAGILGQIGGFQNQNINNQLNASGMLSNEQQTGYENMMAGVQMAPSVYGQQFLPAGVLAGVGGALDAQSQKVLDAKMQQHDAKQNAGFNRAAAIASILGGVAPSMQQTQQTQEPSNPLGSIVGGGLLATQILPSILGFM